jgi:uncharacterized protein
MKQSLKILIIILVAFGFYYFLQKIYFKWLYDFLREIIPIKVISYFFTYVIVGLPLIIGLFLIHKIKNIFSSLGLNKGFLKGFLAAFLFTLPMLIGYSIVFKFNTVISLNQIISGAVIAAFFEELYFRGIFFGQLFRFTKVGFIPSTLLCALIFASSHLWQSKELAILSGIFIITFLGAVFFAWLYIEWGNNLWMPIAMHLFMNLHWMLFSAGENAFGGLYANIFRAAVITFTITGTIIYKKRTGSRLKINQSNLWINKTSNDDEI